MTLTISGVADPATTPHQPDRADFDAWMRQHLVQLPDTLSWDALSARTFTVELSRAAQRAGRAPVPFYELAASELTPDQLGRGGHEHIL